MKENFVNSIHGKKKVRITYYSKKDEANTIRTCAPLDIGPHSRYPDKGDYFHFWDFDGSEKPHVVPKKEEDIIKIEVLSEEFDPSEFITWETNWTISRDWGQYS